MFYYDFNFFGSAEDLEEEERSKGFNKPKVKETQKCYCGSVGKVKCEYCSDLLCGQYYCTVAHNDIKGHLKRYKY